MLKVYTKMERSYEQAWFAGISTWMNIVAEARTQQQMDKWLRNS